METTKVMIVEDSTAVAKDLQLCLTDLGFSVTSIQVSGEEAVACVESECPDAILMDIQLRDTMNGIEAAEIIYSRFEIPIVFLSAFSDSQLLEKAKKVGAFGYLVKPFEERELFATLEMVVCKARSVKEVRELEYRLALLEKQKGMTLMASSIAHSFNNILPVPMGYFEIMLDLLPSNSECRQYVNESARAVEKAAKISSLMLIYTGHGSRDLHEIDFSRVFQEAVDAFMFNLNREHSINIDMTDDDLIFLADNNQIRELVGNILNNATDAIGDAPGEINVSIRLISGGNLQLMDGFSDLVAVRGNYILLEISDNGCGMDEATQEKVFDPFFSTKFTGRGLGMAAVYGIVHGHKGSIAIESQLGEGTLVKVVLPIF